jgi:hypothetical protein
MQRGMKCPFRTDDTGGETGFALWRKSRMCGEVFRSFHLKPQNFRWLEGVLLTTSIALDEKRSRDRKGLKGICFRERDLVTKHHVLAFVGLCIFADHDPEIGGIRPRISGAHCDTPQVRASYAVHKTGSSNSDFAHFDSMGYKTSEAREAFS